MAGVTADRADDTSKRHETIADRGAGAVMAPRRKAWPWKETNAGAAARNEAREAMGMAVRRRFGHLGRDAARFVQLRRDHGGRFLA